MNSINMFSLKAKKAIVTGAGRGLGLKMAKALAGAGADIAMMDVTKSDDTAAAIARDFNIQCKVYQADVAKEDQVNTAIDQIYKDFGAIDILVANAGIHYGGPAETFAMDDWKHIFDVNVHGVFSCAKSVGARMLEQAKGSIILISSVAGSLASRPQPQCAYDTSKGAVTAMTKCLAQEWATRGVRVNSINPGYMMTEALKEVSVSNPELFSKWEQNIPMGRVGNADELNGAVVYLASDASSYMTGAHLYIDGGSACV